MGVQAVRGSPARGRRPVLRFTLCLLGVFALGALAVACGSSQSPADAAAGCACPSAVPTAGVPCDHATCWPVGVCTYFDCAGAGVTTANCPASTWEVTTQPCAAQACPTGTTSMCDPDQLHKSIPRLDPVGISLAVESIAENRRAPWRQLGFGSGPNQGSHFVATGEQLADQGPAKVSGSAANEDAMSSCIHDAHFVCTKDLVSRIVPQIEPSCKTTGSRSGTIESRSPWRVIQTPSDSTQSNPSGARHRPVESGRSHH